MTIRGMVPRKRAWRAVAADVPQLGLEGYPCRNVIQQGELNRICKTGGCARLVDPHGVAVLDETGFLKKGTKLAGSALLTGSAGSRAPRYARAGLPAATVRR